MTAPGPFFRAPADREPVAGMVGAPVSFADVAERLNPAVVDVDASSRGASGRGRRALPSLPGRPDLFERDPTREDGREGLGTGFIFDPSGLILTNHHVIEGADRVTVRLASGRRLRATVVGTDAETDVAVLRVDAGGPLVAAPLGDSDRLRVGEWVCAIGNPLAYEHSVTVGVVSYLGRQLSDRSTERFIQTDAAINLGNSGGPLIDARGQVVGINAAVSARGTSIGFAVPINRARAILPALLETGRVSRGYLGVTVRPLSDDLRRSLGLTLHRGALVQDVAQGSPAARAGIRAYDVLQDVADEPVTTDDALVAAMAVRPPGSAVSVHLVRDGRPVRLTAKLAERPGGVPVRDASRRRPARLGLRGPALGLFVRDLDGEFRMRYRVPDADQGVVVSKVEPLSPAADAAIARGHLVLEINRRPTPTVEDYRREVADAAPGDVLAFYLFDPDEQRHELRTVRVEP